MTPTRAAFVLGSSQSEQDLDAPFCSSRGIDIVRRRSGGGAVWVDPVDSVWVDIVIPRSDPLWIDDVGRAMHFVGRAWCDVLSSLGMGDVIVNDGPHVANDWSKHLCVAGRGTGEVFTHSGAKVIGISQRRTRDYARFQCIAYLAWDVDVHLGALALLRTDRARVEGLVAVVPRVEPNTVVEALASALPAR